MSTRPEPPAAEQNGAPEPAAEKRRFDPGWSVSTWNEVEPTPAPPKTTLQRVRGAARLLGFVLLTLLLLPPFFLARALGGRRERRVAALWCASGLWLSGLRLRQVGAPMSGGGAILANHVSWLDIMLVGGRAPVHFVAKAEIEGWPLFGWIGKIADTVFIARRRAEAKAQEAQLRARARRGDLLCLFPEGTSSDGLRVLPFKSTLFALFFADEDGALRAQPVTLHYAPRAGLAPNFYGWWGSMPLFAHIWDVVCLSSRGVATIRFHQPLEPRALGDRKAMAAEAQRLVEDGVRMAQLGA